MKAFLAPAVVSLMLGGCATTATEIVPSASDIVGTYDMGDGLGICMQVSLLPDGSLSGDECGAAHVGVPSHPFSGSWSLSGATLTFNTPQADLRTAEVFFWKGTPAFVELRNKHGSQAEPWSVFRKRPR